MFLSDSSLGMLGSRFSRASSLRGRGERTAGEIMEAVEVVGAAGAMAYVNARYSDPGADHYQVMGVPADLLGGLLLGGLGLMGFLGEYDKHSVNLGSGMLAAYATRMGNTWGANARVAAATGTAPAAATKGMFTAGAPAMYPTVDAAQYDWNR
jgi:hypothetical protein